ncbi:MAG: MBL fold metallo-hydrolase [Clostridia bacterium]|nr:MAG: MBL fold metallo-hydrolase [Clostridia bacterium]
MFEMVDLHFQNEPEIIASYVLRGPKGVALIETGPGSTVETLFAGLEDLGIAKEEVTDVLLTHIHLDHAGAAGRVARETGATVHVHRVGAPHMIDPSKLLASAGRIYGEMMGPLWGEFLPVPKEQINILDDNDIIDAAGVSVRALDTPGHAFHHMVYWLDGLCFTGDVGAVRLPGYEHIRLPVPPPELHIPLWKQSVKRLQTLKPDRIVPTHFGAYQDVDEHLDEILVKLDALSDYVKARWLAGESSGQLIPDLTAWLADQARKEGVDEAGVHRYEVIVPSNMNVTGLLRYFRKVEGLSV